MSIATSLSMALVAWSLAACKPHWRPVVTPPYYNSTEPRLVPFSVYPHELRTVDTPRTLVIPYPLFASLQRTGKDRFPYEIVVCDGARPFVESVNRSTSFAELDQLIDTYVAELALDLPSSSCQSVTISPDISRATCNGVPSNTCV